MSRCKLSFGKIHYAWVVCTVCAWMLFISMGLNSNVFIVYQPYIISRNGFTNTQGSLLITVRCLFSIVGMLTVDKVYHAITLRWTIGLGILFQIISRIVCAIAQSFPLYCSAVVLSGIAYSWAGTVPISILIGHWFHKSRGSAFGIGTTGSGFATILMPPIITRIVTHYGLSIAFLMEAALTAAVGIIILLFVRDCPEDLGMQPYGVEEKGEDVPTRESCPVNLPRRDWIAVIVTIFLLSATAGAGFNHLTVYFTSEGYSPTAVAWLITYLGITLTVGKVVCGRLNDRFGGWYTNFVIGGFLFSAILCCCFAPVKLMVVLVVSMTLLGPGLSIVTVSLVVWARDLCGDKGYDAAVKWLTLSYAIGAFLFSPLPGMIADYTGSFVPAYVLFLFLTALGLFLIQRIYVKNKMTGKFRSSHL